MSDDEFDEETDEETYSAIRTVLGSTRRTARWHLTDEVDILTAFGRSSFDLRQVEATGRPVAEISVTCVLGTVTLVVPPGTLVVLDGNSFLARAVSEVEPGDVSSLPRIEVTATTVLGRVKVHSLAPEINVAEVAEVVEVAEVAEPTPTETELFSEPVDPSPVEDLAVEEPAVEQAAVEEPAPVDADPDASPLAS